MIHCFIVLVVRHKDMDYLDMAVELGFVDKAVVDNQAVDNLVVDRLDLDIQTVDSLVDVLDIVLVVQSSVQHNGHHFAENKK